MDENIERTFDSKNEACLQLFADGLASQRLYIEVVRWCREYYEGHDGVLASRRFHAMVQPRQRLNEKIGAFVSEFISVVQGRRIVVLLNQLNFHQALSHAPRYLSTAR